jgi:hypothetical protein
MGNLNALESRYICLTSAMRAERDRRWYNALSDTRIRLMEKLRTVGMVV